MRRLRGRPRHNDVLTPREWEVLSLLREGLTNEQIALRLNITFDTAKFHVSEILTKLGVDSRQEAAAWRGTPRAFPTPAATPSIWQRAGLTSPVRVFAAGAIATAAIAMLALTAGLLLMNTRAGDTSAPLGNTDEEELAAIVESLTTSRCSVAGYPLFRGHGARRNDYRRACRSWPASASVVR